MSHGDRGGARRASSREAASAATAPAVDNGVRKERADLASTRSTAELTGGSPAYAVKPRLAQTAGSTRASLETALILDAAPPESGATNEHDADDDHPAP